jgi:hypothetical protein
MSQRLRWPVFWALVAVFVFIVCLFAVPACHGLFHGLWFLSPFVLFCLLGVALIVLAVRNGLSGGLKFFFILTGASAAGVLVSILLHNLVYGLFEYFGGPNFWNGGDEPVFFVMATVVCPLGFLVGVVGTIVNGLKYRRRRSP